MVRDGRWFGREWHHWFALFTAIAVFVWAALQLTGCAAPEDFVQPGDMFVAAVEKQGPIVGINREICPEGETHVLLCGGFVIAVFRTEDCIGYIPVTTAPVVRVDLNWRALPAEPHPQP